MDDFAMGGIVMGYPRFCNKFLFPCLFFFLLVVQNLLCSTTVDALQHKEHTGGRVLAAFSNLLANKQDNGGGGAQRGNYSLFLKF